MNEENKPSWEIRPAGEWPTPAPGTNKEPATSASPEAPGAADETKNCPFCAEKIKVAAIKCRFCNSDLSPPSNSIQPKPQSVHDKSKPKGATRKPAPFVALFLFLGLVIAYVFAAGNQYHRERLACMSICSRERMWPQTVGPSYDGPWVRFENDQTCTVHLPSADVAGTYTVSSDTSDSAEVRVKYSVLGTDQEIKFNASFVPGTTGLDETPVHLSRQ
jgi:hypothetical protein